MQCDAVCCSVLQCGAVCCSVLQCLAVQQCGAGLDMLDVWRSKVCAACIGGHSSGLQCVATFGIGQQCVVWWVRAAKTRRMPYVTGHFP